MVKQMRLETERLIIRPYQEEDFMECFQLMQDKELFQYLDMEVMSLEEFKKLFEWIRGMYDVGFDGDFKYSFNVTLEESGKHIGWCGIGGLDMDHNIKEIYYLIGKEYWGKGYAKEATTALLEYGFMTMELNEIVALCKPENIASRKVIENLGLKFKYIMEGLPDEPDDKAFYIGEPFFSLTKEEYIETIKK